MMIVDPLATKAAAAADRVGTKTAVSLRSIIVDLPEVKVAAATDPIGMKMVAS